MYGLPKIKKVIKDAFTEYFIPQDYSLILYEDGDYSMCLGEEYKVLDGKKNYDAKYQMAKIDEISYFKDCYPEEVALYRKSYNTINSRIKLLSNDIRNRLGISNNFSNIYNIKPGDEDYKQFINDINKTLEVFRESCERRDIEYITDANEKIKDIIQRLNEKVDPFTSKIETKSTFCYSLEAIKEEFKKDLENATTEEQLDSVSFKYESANGNLVDYVAELLQAADLAVFSLEYRMPDREEILKEYTEFLIVIPEFLKLISLTEECCKKANEMRKELKQKRFDGSQEFLDRIDDIIEHDDTSDTYLYHVTPSKYDADRIIDEGLYMFSNNLASTTFEELKKETILKHGYGNSYQMYEDYIIIVDKPNDVDIVRKLTEEERKACKIVPRRMGLTNKPSYIIDTDYIVGYIDKENMEVIKNPNYKGYSR